MRHLSWNMTATASTPVPMSWLAWLALCLATASASAQQRPAPPAAGDSGAAPVASLGPGRGADDWLTRLRQASRAPAFTGTYVVWSAPGVLASSRIWHASRGDVEVERVDALSGEPRSTYRVVGVRGNRVVTFLYASHVLRIDRRDTPGGGFPNLPGEGQDGVTPARYYDARQTGQERVAGFMADVVQFAPRDGMRYGYRVWSDQRTGLALKLQTLDEHGHLLEQAAFSGLTFDAQINADVLLREMHHRHGWRVERVARAPTTALAEGWQIGGATGQPVPGFALQRCYRQPDLMRGVGGPAGGASVGDTAASGSAASSSAASSSVAFGLAANGSAAGGPATANPVTQVSSPNPAQGRAATRSRWFQCVFSDGLAAVSVFIEPYDATQHTDDSDGAQEAALGATHLLARRVGDTGWVTVMGEVPPRTLKRFVAEVSPLP